MKYNSYKASLHAVKVLNSFSALLGHGHGHVHMTVQYMLLYLLDIVLGKFISRRQDGGTSHNFM